MGYDMLKFKAIVGETFGYLTVVEQIESNKRGDTRFKCKCKCGNEVNIKGANLRSGHTKSCGCLRRAKDVNGVSALNRIVNAYRQNARSKGIIFELSNDDVKHLIFQNCHYCNKSPSQIERSKHTDTVVLYTGIDRVDSTKGYIKDNVVPCCERCNYAKNAFSEKMFLNRIKIIAEREARRQINLK